MAVTTVPDWLARRDGSLKPGVAPHMVFVLIGGTPMYKVEARPAGGKHIAAVQQANTGRRLDEGTTYPTADAALAGGLEQLRAALGW